MTARDGFSSVDAVKRANQDSGYHFFDPDTLRFFSSRVSDILYGRRYFVTSERDRHSSRPRRYTVRMARDDGSVDTIGPFCELSRSAAHALARRCAAEGAPVE